MDQSQIRVRCLELALQALGLENAPHDSATVLNVAAQFEGFVNDGAAAADAAIA